MIVLVACEESQTVCKAFRARGDIVFSCDIQEPSGGHPEWHIHGDVLPLIKHGAVSFTTMDGTRHTVSGWDLIIAHPPCTYLTKAGACCIPKHPERIQKGEEAARFFRHFVDYGESGGTIAIENPIIMKRWGLPTYSQIIHPYMFGHPYTKATCLWLYHLPPLHPTNIVAVSGSWMDVSKYRDHRRSIERSKTFPGIAAAMADQWRKYIISQEE